MHGFALFANVAKPYVLDERKRTYKVDFHVKPDRMVYEVKPAYVLNCPGNQQIKWDVAREFLLNHGLGFLVVTENDFIKVTFEVARQDPNVVWKEETFRYFKS